MKVIAVMIAVLLALLGLVTQTQAQSRAELQQKRVSVAVTTAAVRISGDTRTDVLLLWNRDIRTSPIGHAVKACIRAGAGGVLGSGLMSCNLTVSLPLGKVVAAGVVHSLQRYTLVTTGGTGVYRRVSGPLHVRSITGDGVRRMIFYIP